MSDDARAPRRARNQDDGLGEAAAVTDIFIWNDAEAGYAMSRDTPELLVAVESIDLLAFIRGERGGCSTHVSATYLRVRTKKVIYLFRTMPPPPTHLRTPPSEVPLEVSSCISLSYFLLIFLPRAVLSAAARKSLTADALSRTTKTHLPNQP